MKKIKIRFLINTLGGGGAEKVLIDLLHRLDVEKYELTLTTIGGGVHQTRIPSYVEYFQIVRTRNHLLDKLLEKCILKLPCRLFALLFLPGNFDIEVAYLEGRPVRFVAAKRSKAAKVAFVHCDLSVKNTIASLYRNNEQCLREYQSFTKVCFVSEQGNVGFEKSIGQLTNACVVHNVVDLERVRILAEKEPIVRYQNHQWKLVAVGRLVREKAFDRLLRIIAKLEKRFDLELWILGDGERRQQLEKLVLELNIQSVRLLGYQENPYSLIRQADLFICSSLSEGYSTAVLEAIALGVPVITTNCAGMEEILNHGEYGVIVDNSEEALYHGVQSLLSTNEYYDNLKSHTIQRSNQLLNNDAIEEYERLFNNVLME